MTRQERMARDMRLLNELFPYNTLEFCYWGLVAAGFEDYEYACFYSDIHHNTYCYHAYVDEDGKPGLRPVPSIQDAVDCMNCPIMMITGWQYVEA